MHPHPGSHPPFDELPGTVVAERMVAASDLCALFVEEARVYTSGVLVRLSYRFRDRETAADHIQITSARAERAGPRVRMTGPDLEAISHRPDDGAPTVVRTTLSGGGTTWTAGYWITPLPAEGMNLAVEWEACDLGRREWRLAGESIDTARGEADELRELARRATAAGRPIQVDVVELAGIRARLAGLGATLKTPLPHISHDPVVKIPISGGDITVHEIEEENIPNVVRLLQGSHLIEVHGADLDASLIALDAPAPVARAMATWLNRGAEKDPAR